MINYCIFADCYPILKDGTMVKNMKDNICVIYEA